MKQQTLPYELTDDDIKASYKLWGQDENSTLFKIIAVKAQNLLMQYMVDEKLLGLCYDPNCNSPAHNCKRLREIMKQLGVK